MATSAEDTPRSPEVQRAQAEERRQRLEEEKHQLEVWKYELETRKHDLEKNKVINDVLKHFTTVIAALIAILGYFGTELVPRLKADIFLGMSSWDFVMLTLGLCLAISLTSLGGNAVFPDTYNEGFPLLIYALLLLLAAAIIVLVLGLTNFLY